MLTNLFETNFSESVEFINIKLFIYVILFGIIPSIIFTKYFSIEYKNKWYISFIKQFLVILLIVVLNISSRPIFPNYYHSLRSVRRLSFNLIPINYISSSVDVLIKSKIKRTISNFNVEKISDDAVFNDVKNRRNLVVFVIGESARANNFSLNGYGRDTNKYLEKEDLINFSNFYSCGTATFISVPCMFSHLDREHFSVEEDEKYENVLDIFKKVGFDLYWKSNNGGCKSVCNRIDYSRLKVVNSKEYDTNFIDYLKNKIDSLEKKNNFIVLHTRGSHAPLYNNRYPKEFEIFKPSCNKNATDCDYESLVNSYDNSIYYTSYVIEELINILKNNKKFNSILFYVSDHGDSLGEDGQFMHGTPYNIANDYQKHVPFFIWISEDFEKNFNIDRQCLKNKGGGSFSHDNIFHSLLGVFKIKSSYYDENLDIFNGCLTIY